MLVEARRRGTALAGALPLICLAGDLEFDQQAAQALLLRSGNLSPATSIAGAGTDLGMDR